MQSTHPLTPNSGLDPFSSHGGIGSTGRLAAPYVHLVVVVLGGAEESGRWGLQDTPSKGQQAAGKLGTAVATDPAWVGEGLQRLWELLMWLLWIPRELALGRGREERLAQVLYAAQCLSVSGILSLGLGGWGSSIWSLEIEPRPGRGLHVHPSRVSLLWDQVISVRCPGPCRVVSMQSLPWASVLSSISWRASGSALGAQNTCLLKTEKH